MMDLFNELNESNFTLYAAKHYYNPTCIDSEDFYEDLKRFKYIKRLLNRYKESGEISERLLLNHIIVVFNVFGIQAAKTMLEYKLEGKHWSTVKTFLLFLKYIKNDEYTGVPLDPVIVEKLRKI